MARLPRPLARVLGVCLILAGCASPPSTLSPTAASVPVSSSQRGAGPATPTTTTATALPSATETPVAATAGLPAVVPASSTPPIPAATATPPPKAAPTSIPSQSAPAAAQSAPAALSWSGATIDLQLGTVGRLTLPALSAADLGSAPTVAIDGLPAPAISLVANRGFALTMTVPATATAGGHLLTARWPSGHEATLHVNVGATLPLAGGLGEPDDVVVAPDGSIVFSDLRSNTVRQILSDGSVRTLIQNLSIPEGVAIAGPDRLVVAEQGTNRVTLWTAFAGTRSLLQLPPRAGAEGIDGLSLATVGGQTVVLVPDSANGRLMSLRLDTGTTTPILGRWSRPTDAVVQGDQVYMVDEYGGRLWLGPLQGPLHPLGPSLSLPDDVAVAADGTVFVNELSGVIREIHPDGQAVPLLRGLHNPQGLALDGAGNLILAESDTARISAYVRTCRPMLVRPEVGSLRPNGPPGWAAVGSDCAAGSAPPGFSLAAGSVWPSPGEGAPHAGTAALSLPDGSHAALAAGTPPGSALIELVPPASAGVVATATLEVQLRLGGDRIPMQIESELGRKPAL